MEEALGAGGAAESFQEGGPSCLQVGLSGADVVVALTWPRTQRCGCLLILVQLSGTRAAVLGFGSVLLF